MDDTIRRSNERWWTAAVLAVLVGIGVGAAVAADSVWVLAIATGLCLVAGLAPSAGWTLGLVCAVAVPLAVEAFAIRVFHKIGLGIAAGDIVVLVVLALAGLILLVTSPGRFRMPGRDVWWGVLPAAVVPAAVGAVFAVLPLLRSGAALSWAMHSDAVWNLVSARFILADDGLIPSLHPNSSPLTATLLAAGMAPGRAAGADLFAHDIAAMATVFALSTVFASLLAGIVVAQAISAAHPVLRSIGAVLGSALIASWFVAGFSFQFGFYNVMPTVACLLASWLAWRRARHSPVTAVALLLALTTALLALWAFLAVVPFALAAVAAVRHILRTPRSVGWPAWSVLAVAGLQLVAYVALFSLPDLRHDEGALAQGGSMAPVSPALLFVMIGLTVLATAVTATTVAARSDLAGAVTVSASLVVTDAYLASKVQSFQYGWGYYPAKLVWFGGILLLVVFLGVVLDRISRAPLTRWPLVAAAGAAVVVVAAVAGSVLPKPPTFGALVPYADMLAGTGVASGDAVVPTIFALDDPADAKNMLVGYFDWRADDFANLWLLGASASSGTDPIRPYSYTLDTTSPAEVCDAVRAWGGDVTIHTRSASLQAALAAACPDLAPRVSVGVIAPPG